jgi:hypothetical protein
MIAQRAHSAFSRRVSCTRSSDGFTIASIVGDSGYPLALRWERASCLAIATLIGRRRWSMPPAAPTMHCRYGGLHAVCRGNGPHAGSQSGDGRQNGVSGFCGDGIVSAGQQMPPAREMAGGDPSELFFVVDLDMPAETGREFESSRSACSWQVMHMVAHGTALRLLARCH